MSSAEPPTDEPKPVDSPGGTDNVPLESEPEPEPVPAKPA